MSYICWIKYKSKHESEVGRDEKKMRGEEEKY